jgi:hypothetical protein
MMMHGYRHQGRKSGGAFWSIAFGIVALGVGAYVVYQLIGWFRASHEETVAEAESSNAAFFASSASTLAAPVVLDGSASVTLVTGGSAGVVYRRGTSEHAEYNTVLNLPALAPETSYELWMVKDGLADVQTAGMLDVRADGTFAKVFSVVDPAEFSTVVIMLEPNDGVATPSGTIVAQGSF